MTDHGIIEGETHAIVRQDAVVSLHSSDSHLCSHSQPSGPDPRVAGEEAHQIERNLVRVAKRPTYLQISVVRAVTFIAEIEGESWCCEK